jgi:vacuolar-type H+-ATPase subunit H
LAEPAYPATTYPATAEAGGSDSTAGQVAGRAKETATDVKDTAKEQAQRVGSEARSQARNVASDVRDRVGHQARSQNDKLVGSIRQTADQLDEMRGDRTDSPAATVVSRVADGGRQLADYLDRNGPEGVLREVQDFARRRPGAFLATALAAGFVVGRLGKGVAKADSDAGGGKPDTDSFVSTGTGTSAGYAPSPGPSTEYAATGTGTPVVVEEDYVRQTLPADNDQPGGPR